MKKFYLFSMTLLLSLSVGAQDVDVPLFDDDVPNLGRKAKPLDHIVVTPSQLPDVRVDISPEKKQAKPIVQVLKEDAEKKKAEGKAVQPTVEKIIAEPKTAKPIVLQEQFSDAKAKEMNEQLQNEIARYQQEKARAEQEARNRKEAAVKAKAEQEAQKQKKLETHASGETVPESIKDLFGRSADVYTFDISGIELGMTPDEVVEKAVDAGYRVIKVEHGIPLHRTSFYDASCRAEGLKRLEVIQNCIIDMAREDEVYYVSSITFAKDETAEYVQVLFSTKVTDNVSYKIYYENKGDNSLNFTRRNLAKKLRRRDAFMQMLFDTYGAPDDRDQLVWGDLDKAYMKAQMQGSNYNAYLILEDKEISNEDWADAEERKGNLHYKHSFTFGNQPEDEE